MTNWIHRLLNPHCVECRDELAESRVCQSCEALKMQLAIVNAEKQRLSDVLYSLVEKPKLVETEKSQDNRKLFPKLTTWNVHRQMLEAEDRKAAEILKKKADDLKSAKSIDDLEKEVGLGDAQSTRGNDREDVQSLSNATNEEEASTRNAGSSTV